MVLPIALGALSAAPAVAGFLGNLFDSDRSEARRLAREEALGRGPTALAARAAVDRAAKQMAAVAQAQPSINPLGNMRNAMLAGAELQSSIVPQVAQMQANAQRQGRADLAALGGEQGNLLQQGLGALSSGLAGMTGFLAANPESSGGMPARAEPAASGVTPAMLSAPMGIRNGFEPQAFGRGQEAAPNLGNVAGNLSTPFAPSAAPSPLALGGMQPSTFGSGPMVAPARPPMLGGAASQLQLPQGMQFLDPRLLAMRGFGT